MEFSNGNTKPFDKERSLALIFCNNYAGTSMDLKEGPLNDGLLAYERFAFYGYKPFIYHDLKKKEFKQVLKSFLSARAKKLVIYFTGHGTQKFDWGGDEDDHKDEAFVLMDGNFVDDDMKKYLDKYNNAKQLTLISDCCHSGTIFDLPKDSPILTISACQDKECAMQTRIEHKTNGCFSYYFWKYMNESRDSRVIQPKINAKLAKYKHSCVFNHDCEHIL